MSKHRESWMVGTIFQQDAPSSANAALAHEQLIGLILSATGLHVWTLDIRAHRITVATTLCAVLGLTARQCRRPGAWRRLIQADDRQRVEQAIRECLAGGRELDVEFRVLRGAGGPLRLSVRAKLIDDAIGGKQLYGICADITGRLAEHDQQRDRERLAQAQHEALAQTDSDAAERDEFLSIVSHDLRGPLNAIQNWTQVLKSQFAPDPQTLMQRALAGIQDGVEQQVKRIDDLMDASRIMSNRLRLNLADIDIRPTIEAAIADVRAAAAARNVTLAASLYRAQDKVRADPQRFRKIADSLLANALKFTAPGGHIRVSLDRVGDQVRLVVADDGRGIDAAQLPHLFEGFTRRLHASPRGRSGLGLGLAMVQRLCELHGGSVRASSAGLGHGTTFEVRMPLLLAMATAVESAADAARLAASELAYPSLSGLRVIAIDDQPDALETVSLLLTSMNAQVHAFPSGEAFMRWLVPQGIRHSVDVVLCDIAMPRQDGYTTLSRIRAHESRMGSAWGECIPVIALTAFSAPEDRRRALAAGFALHVGKPATAEQLGQAILSIGRDGS